MWVKPIYVLQLVGSSHTPSPNRHLLLKANENCSEVSPTHFISTFITGWINRKKPQPPPKHFTDATILGALTGISRYVTNSEIKKSLRDTDGLGTEATRAGIIELLFKRLYLLKKGKNKSNRGWNKANNVFTCANFATWYDRVMGVSTWVY